MKRLLTLTAAALGLCCMAQAQPQNITFNGAANWGRSSSCTSGAGTGSTQLTIPTGTTVVVAVLLGDLVTGHDDITAVSYGHTGAYTNFTLVDKWTGPNGSQSTNRFMYMYKLDNPTDVGVNDYFEINCTNPHYINGILSFYANASDVIIPTGSNHLFGPDSAYGSPGWGTQNRTNIGGSWVVMAMQGPSPTMVCEGPAGATCTWGTPVNRITEPVANTPSIVDSNMVVDPFSRYWYMKAEFGSGLDDARIMAEIVPITAGQFIPVSKQYTSSNAWVFNASDSGLVSCDYSLGVWDTTTSPFNNLSSSISSTTCDGSFNVTVNYAGNETGIMVLIPNPTD